MKIYYLICYFTDGHTTDREVTAKNMDEVRKMARKGFADFTTLDAVRVYRCKKGEHGPKVATILRGPYD